MPSFVEDTPEPAGRAAAVVRQLEALGDPAAVAGMARYGIVATSSLGVTAPRLHRLARQLGRDHALALALWDTGIRDARILAALIDDPRQVTAEQAERWVGDFASWDVCDACCSYLFDRTPHAVALAHAWSAREPEFVKRAGFVLMATLAVHDKRAADAVFEGFLALVPGGATDERNFVKKAVNWALRQIGKRNAALHRAAVATAEEVRRLDSRAARWVAADALRELRSQAVRRRLGLE